MASAGNHRYAKALVFEDTADYNSDESNTPGESNTLVCHDGILYFNGKQLSSPQGNHFDIFTANKVTRLSGSNIQWSSNLVVLPHTESVIDPSNSAGQGFQADASGFLYYNGVQISAFSNIYQDSDPLTSNSVTPLGNTSFVVHSNLVVDNVMAANTQTVTIASKTLHFSNAGPQITFNSQEFNIQPVSKGTNVQFLGAASGSDCNVNFVSTDTADVAGSDLVNLKFKSTGHAGDVHAKHTVSSIKVAQSTPFNQASGGGSMSLTCRTPTNGTDTGDTQLNMIHMNTHTDANTIVIAPDTDARVGIMAGYAPTHRFQVGSNLYVDDNSARKTIGIGNGYKIQFPSNVWLRGTSGDRVTIGPSSTQAGPKSVVIGTAGGDNSNVVSIGFGHSSTILEGAIRVGSNITGSGANAISIGRNAKASMNGVVIGHNAGTVGTTVAHHSIAIGNDAGSAAQSSYSIAVGSEAGRENQESNAVAIGHLAGRTSQKAHAVAIGHLAGQTSQASNAVAIGQLAGHFGQKLNAVGIGFKAGEHLQESSSVAIGYFAGQSNQSAYSVAIGHEAGSSAQSSNSVAIGQSAGKTSQSSNSVAIGHSAGETSQSSNSVAIGHSAGETSQDIYSIAIGYEAGKLNQGVMGVAIGTSAGASTQGSYCLAICGDAGHKGQNNYAVALGQSAGYDGQGEDGIAIGRESGGNTQGRQAIAIGAKAGDISQGARSIAIGYNAGKSNMGLNSIAIGFDAKLTGDGSIMLNASGGEFKASKPNSFFVKPIANGLQTTITSNLLLYNSGTGEVHESNIIHGNDTDLYFAKNTTALKELHAKGAFKCDFDPTDNANCIVASGGSLSPSVTGIRSLGNVDSRWHDLFATNVLTNTIKSPSNYWPCIDIDDFYDPNHAPTRFGGATVIRMYGNGTGIAVTPSSLTYVAPEYHGHRFITNRNMDVKGEGVGILKDADVGSPNEPVEDYDALITSHTTIIQSSHEFKIRTINTRFAHQYTEADGVDTDGSHIVAFYRTSTYTNILRPNPNSVTNHAKSSLGESSYPWTDVHATNLHYSTCSCPSDDRLKHNEEDVVGALETINKLKLQKYDKTSVMMDADFNGDLTGVASVKEIGFIAQEVLKIPELALFVGGGGTEQVVDSEAVHDDKTNKMVTPATYKTVDVPYNLNYVGIATYAIQAIQELDSKYKAKISNLESTVAMLVSRLDALEN